jgi:hypothetical protein
MCRVRRQNQACDDKEIRTKIRSLDSKRKKAFEDKMKTKIRFTDIIKDNNINDDTDSNNVLIVVMYSILRMY